MRKDKSNSDNSLKIWNTKYDFSEIDRTNYHKILNSYFKLTTKKVTLLSMLVVLNIISAVISQFVLTALSIGGFLSVSITFWTILLTYMSLGAFYAFIFLEITTWFRMALGNDAIQVLSLNLSDLTFLIFFALIAFIINYIRIRVFEVKNKKIGYLITLLVSATLTLLITSGMDVLYNKYFLIDMYQYSAAKITVDGPLLIMIFWFNILQYAINVVIFGFIFNVSYILIDKYKY